MKKRLLIISILMMLTWAFPSSASSSMSKGLLVQDYNMLDDAAELGVEEILYNVTSSNWAANKEAILWLADRMWERGFKLTVVLLKNTSGGTGSHYEMFGTEDVDFVKDVAASLGSRACRFIIGNEVNNQEWNYAGNKDTITYCKQYGEIFSKCYYAIKEAVPSAEVYIPFDYGWYNESNNSSKYSGREMLQRLAGILPRDMDWGVAWHPYPDPIGDPDFTDDSIASDDTYANIVNFKNLHVLTDYMKTEPMLKADGSVRNIILSEQGFSSVTDGAVNEDLQAEMFERSWRIAEADPCIKAYILSRQVDAPAEKANGWAFGLWNSTSDETATTKKKIWETYKNIRSGSPAADTVLLQGPS